MIEIISDGQAIVEQERPPKTVTLLLNGQKLASIEELLTAADLAPLNDSLPSCNDCFVYEIRHTPGRDKTTAKTVNDVNLRRSGLEPLVKHLRSLIDSALQDRL